MATIRARVQRDVDDTGEVVFTDDDVDRAIRRALREYSVKLPRTVAGNLTVATAGRSQSMSGLTGLIDVQRVWFPYYSTEPDLMPTWVPFEVQVAGTLFLRSQDSPAVGDVIRVFYTAWHTIDDLDAATATTVPDVDEDLIALGAAGYVCEQKARGAIGVVNVSGYTPLHWRGLAAGLISRFEAGLYAAQMAASLRASGWEAMAAAG